MLDHTRQYDFSFSGMKAQAYQLLNELNSKEIELTEGIIHDICDQFEQAITTTLWNKLLLAAQHHQAATVGIVG
jgi:tRNA A37 threonylcarbamoyltransferase TsaD